VTRAKARSLSPLLFIQDICQGFDLFVRQGAIFSALAHGFLELFKFQRRDRRIASVQFDVLGDENQNGLDFRDIRASSNFPTRNFLMVFI